MNKYRPVNIIIFVLAIFYSGCKKDESTIQTIEETQIQSAKHYFNKDIAGNAASYLIPTGDIGFNQKNPRKQLARKPLWEKASLIKLSFGMAVIVPVRYDNPFIIKSNFGGNKFYNINDLTKLLIYQDKDQRYHAELITSIPDSNYTSLQLEAFKGLISVEDWWGNSISKYKYERNGIIKKFNASIKDSSASSVETQVSISKNQRTISGQSNNITICYEISGYNYSVNDPGNGYYWSESLGCETYYANTDSGYVANNEYINGTNYGNVSTGGYGSSPMLPASQILVYSGDNIIGDIKDYNKCFTNIPGNDYSYEVTLCVTQPVAGTREAWAFSSLNGSSANGSPVFVGHTFLMLTQRTPTQTITRNVGFYPKTSITPYSPTVQGQLNNDEIHDYNVSATIKMTGSQFTDILSYVSQGNNLGYMYDLNTNNCTTFALNALSSVGFYMPRTNGVWQNGGGVNPGDLGEDIRNMVSTSNLTIKTHFAWHYNQGKCY